MPDQDTQSEGSKKDANLFQRLKPDQRTSRLILAVSALVLLLAWAMNTPPGLEGKADAIGYALCHQISVRSFQINGQPLSLCARCTGMYVGIMVGLAYQLLLGRRRAEWPDRYKLVVLGLFLLGFAVDGSNSALKLYLGEGLLYEPSNTLRLITASYSFSFRYSIFMEFIAETGTQFSSSTQPRRGLPPVPEGPPLSTLHSPLYISQVV